MTNIEPTPKKRKNNGDWKRRCAEAELVIEHCSAAMALIPIWALEKEQQWIPSPEALVTLKRAKDSLNDFVSVHFLGKTY